MNAPVTTAPVLTAEETALLTGDLAKLSADQRANLYRSVCSSVGLNPLTRPFDYLVLNGRMVLYARKDATDQLRKLNAISVTISKPEVIGDLVYVSAHASTPQGRTDEDLGAVTITGLRGEALSNAVLKAITKAKRRVTLSICGMGMLDESEVDSIPGATRVEETPMAQLSQAPEDTSDAYAKLVELQANIHTLTGVTEPIYDGMSVAQCRAEYKRLTGLLKAAQAKTKGNDMAKFLSDADAAAFVAMDVPI